MFRPSSVLGENISIMAKNTNSSNKSNNPSNQSSSLSSTKNTNPNDHDNVVKRKEYNNNNNNNNTINNTNNNTVATTATTASFLPLFWRGNKKLRMLVYLILTSLGIGIVFGFVLFFILYRNQCAVRLFQAETQYNQTLQQQQLQSSIEPHRRLVLEQDLKNLQAKHDYLVELHEDTVLRLSKGSQQCQNEKDDIQEQVTRYKQSLKTAAEQVKEQQGKVEQLLQTSNTQQEEYSLEIQQLQTKLQNLQDRFEQQSVQTEKQTTMLKGQLELSKSMLQNKNEELERMRKKQQLQQSNTNTDKDDDDEKKVQVDPQLIQLTTAIKRQNVADLVSSFYCDDDDDEYNTNNHHNNNIHPKLCAVEFTVTGGDSFVVQFDNDSVIQDMPHAIVTFFKMVQAGLFTQTKISINPKNHNPHGIAVDVARNNNNQMIILGGSSNSRSSTTTTTTTTTSPNNNWKELYTQSGFSFPHPTLFSETSPPHALCQEYTMGFLHQRGPELIIPLSDSSSSYSCPGKIVQGTETIDKLQRMLSLSSSSSSENNPNQVISIVHAKIVQPPNLQQQPQQQQPQQQQTVTETTTTTMNNEL